MSYTGDTNEFYDGSTLLSPIGAAIGLSIDQMNFLVCQLLALLLGFPYRSILGPHRVSPTVRHAVQVVVGIPLLLFCFGGQAKHIFAQGAVCLILMRYLKQGVMEKVVFVVAMGYLCVTHIYRMVYDYGGYTLDITGPLMISTQRLTSLAYNIADGQVTDESKLSDGIKRHLIKRHPTLLEYASYMFCFHGLMCGPFCFYNDYIAFIDGSNYHQPAAGSQDVVSDNAHGVRSLPDPPDPTRALISKSLCAAVCGVLWMVVVPLYPCMSIIEPGFESHSFLYKMYFIIVSTSFQRQKYYFAWKLSELVNVNAGLGYNGLDSQGRPSWNLIDNTEIYYVETSTSLKVLLDSWNKMTTHWLRYVVYERLHSTLAVFLFSAFWHGFYIGYYLTFLGGGLFIVVSRMVRRKIRPVFQTSEAMARLYDVLTFLATRVSIAYLTFPFVLLEFWPSIAIYSQLYFWLHIVVILTGVLLMFWSPTRPARSKQE